MTEHLVPHVADAYAALLLDAQARHLTQNTLDWYKYLLGPFIDSCGDATVDAITTHTIRKFLAQRAQGGLSGRSLKNHACAIRAVCNFCVREEWTAKCVDS